MKLYARLIAVFTLLSFFVLHTKAAAPTETSQDFYRQLAILQNIEPYVERVDLSRIYLIQTSVKTVIQNMEDNVAAKKQEVTMQTMKLIQNLIIQYRFSKVFFGWIEPKPITSIYSLAIEEDLNELQILSDELVTNYGFDDSPYTQITANTFRQMQKLLQQLETLNIDASLKTKLRDLWMPIGEVIAIAEQGDRPKTFAAAIPVIDRVRNLYPMFDQVSSSSAGFSMIMELQGLTEFYAEFAQMP